MNRAASAVALAVVGVVALVCAGCGVAADATGSAPPSPEPASARTVVPPVGMDAGPPFVTVTGDDDGGLSSVDLEPWTWCWSSGCADGGPPPEPADLGSGDELVVGFPAPGWEFEATFRPAGQRCGPAQRVPLEPSGGSSGGTEALLVPAGRAGTYDVDLFGRGPEGDVFVTGRWTTTADGPLATPTAHAAVLADHDGVVDSYGVELQVDDLATTPDRADARITVTSAQGRSVTLDVPEAGAGCGEEGSLFFAAPAALGVGAAALGSAPFTYDVELTLDGRLHRARATWPDDVVADVAPSVPLRFDPPLPADS